MSISNDNSPFAEGFRKILEDKHINHAAFARALGRHPQRISDMLNGRTLIKAADMVKIADELGVSVLDIFNTGSLECGRGTVKGCEGGKYLSEDWAKLSVETDEENPVTIAAIMSDYIETSEGYRVRMTPK